MPALSRRSGPLRTKPEPRPHREAASWHAADERLTESEGRHNNSRTENMRRWLAAGSLDNEVGDISTTVDRLISALDTRDSMSQSNQPSNAETASGPARSRDDDLNDDLSFREDADFGEVARRIANFRRSRPDPLTNEPDERYRRPQDEPLRRATRRSFTDAPERPTPAARVATPSEPSRTGDWNLNWRDYLEEERGRPAPAEPEAPEFVDAEPPADCPTIESVLQDRLAALRAHASATAPSPPAAPRTSDADLAPAVAFARALLGDEADDLDFLSEEPETPEAYSEAPDTEPEDAGSAEWDVSDEDLDPAAADTDTDAMPSHDFAAWAALAVLQKEQERAREERAAATDSAARAEERAQATADRIEGLAERLDRIQAVDFEARFDRIEAIDFETRFNQIEQRLAEPAPMPETVDLAPLSERLRALEDRITDIERVATERHESICAMLADLADKVAKQPDPSERLDAIELDLDALARHAEAHATNLHSLEVLADAVERLEARLAAQERAPVPRDPDPRAYPSRPMGPAYPLEDYIVSGYVTPGNDAYSGRPARSDRFGNPNSDPHSSNPGVTSGRAMNEREAILERYRRQTRRSA
ncbi:hypothetical protein [Amorphus sp. 3PC139-8]|uniref:hypothetical protein n=1 Tax=Amorphus sp. 3PC139-8 TaxID=2735676 RepID=UPI00345CF12D